MKSSSSRFRSRSRDFALYIAISLAVVLMLVVLGRSSLSFEMANRWFSLAFFTAILYGTFIALNRALYRNRSFWVLTAILLLAHLVLFITVVTQIPHWRSIWSAVMFFEAPVLDALKDRFASSRSRGGK